MKKAKIKHGLRPLPEFTEGQMQDAQRVSDEMRKKIDEIRAKRDEILERFTEAFIAGSDLTPDQIELIEEHGQNGVRWYFKKRDEVKNVKTS